MKTSNEFITLETSAPYADNTAREGCYAICDPCGFYLATREAAEAACIGLDDIRNTRWDWDRRPSGPPDPMRSRSSLRRGRDAIFDPPLPPARPQHRGRLDPISEHFHTHEEASRRLIEMHGGVGCLSRYIIVRIDQ